MFKKLLIITIIILTLYIILRKIANRKNESFVDDKREYIILI